MPIRPPEPDPNESAARVVREATGHGDKPLPPDLEAAWAEWSASIKGIEDERVWTLLRAAFEAGVEARRAQSESMPDS